MMATSRCSGRSQAVAGRWGRAAVWGALAGLTCLLARTEVRRPQVPEGVEARTDLVYRQTDSGAKRLDLIYPRAPAPAGGRPAVVAIHGGAWRGGSKHDLRPLAIAFAQHGYVVAAVDYRLSRPGAPSWPENLEDVREAVRWVRRNAQKYGIDRERIAAVGLSAGGHLAALLGTQAGPGDAISADVAAVVDFYGPADLDAARDVRPTLADSVAAMLGTADSAEARRDASPVFNVSTRTRPMLLIHGTDDRIVPLGQSQALAAALAAAHVPHRLVVVENARHGFGLTVGRRDLFAEILDFLADPVRRGSRAGATANGEFGSPRSCNSADDLKRYR